MSVGKAPQPTLAHQLGVPVVVAGAAGVQAVGGVHLFAAQHKGVRLFGLQQADVARTPIAGNRLGKKKKKI